MSSLYNKNSTNSKRVCGASVSLPLLCRFFEYSVNSIKKSLTTRFREDNKFFSSKKKKLTKRIAKELLDKGWCRVTGLYTPKKPQLYDEVIRLDDSGGKYVSFKMEFDR